jgi:hypothetical protein
MTDEKPEAVGVFRWIDTPWMVAAALGIWGVGLGIEAYLLADIAAAIAAAFAAARLSRETLIWTGQRRPRPFVLGMLVIACLIWLDFWWTGKQKVESEAKRAQLSQLEQIPRLHQLIEDDQKAAMARRVEEVRSEQRLADIGDDNKRLKASIEKKDAILAKIAEEQYALNFTPQVLVTTEDKPDDAYLRNLGKTNIEAHDFHCELLGSLLDSDVGRSTIIAPGGFERYSLNEIGQQRVVASAQAHPGGTLPLPCHAMIVTLDKKQYSLHFVWSFVTKENKIDRSFTTVQQIQSDESGK